MEENIKPSEISKVLLEELRQVDLSAKTEEVGEVLTASDGVVRIWGLNSAEAGELLEFENGEKAVVMNLEVDNVGAVLLGSTDTVKEGDVVRRTYRTASIDVRESMLGRVITPLGEPLDGGGEITGESFRMPLERKAPGVIFRQPVNEPLQTGIKAIDSMIPIGRGQRELIIGDRQTGKTSIAIDTIINQRAGYENGDPVYCIYVAIGQKASTVATIVETLRTYKAMDYTIVIAATAGDSAALRYYAPFAGAAVGEYFRDTGRHALVIYDDLSKQAVAYREVSLILKRPSGREAYPGDIFYLHSRLLERAAKIIGQQEVAEMMNDLPESMKGRVKAGGSLTALPIIETQAGDVSAYIPTNVISITDGQIFLETDLFNQGNRPAINVGISVSRVGGNAQTKAMKKVAGTLKIDQAQYRELEAFSKYSSDMDAISMMTLDKGRKNTRLLIQPLHSVMPVEKQIAVLYCGTKALMKDIPLEKVPEFERLLLEQLSANETFEQIRTKGITPEVSLKEIKARISSVSSTLKITQAMKMVASAKLRKAQRMVGGLDDYKSALYETLERLSAFIANSSLAAEGAAGKVALVVFSSNTALCGSYNANIFKALQSRVALLQEDGAQVEIIPVGEKVLKMARKAGLDVNADFVAAGDALSYEEMAAFARYLEDGFVGGRFSRVELLYMHYYNAARQSIVSRGWLPVARNDSAADAADDDLIVEPSAQEVVDELLPLVLRTDMYATLLSSNASENAARMIAMQTASDNAEDLLSQLRLTYNKQRQQDITEELTDISNGKLG